MKDRDRGRHRNKCVRVCIVLSMKRRPNVGSAAWRHCSITFSCVIRLVILFFAASCASTSHTTSLLASISRSLSDSVSMSTTRVLGECVPATSLKVDTNLRIITIEQPHYSVTSTQSQGRGVICIPQSGAAVSIAAATRMCVETFGRGFIAAMSGVTSLSQLATGAHSFSADLFFSFTCPPGLFPDGTQPSSDLDLAACSVCPVATCTAVATVSCKAPLVVGWQMDVAGMPASATFNQQAVPLRVVEPPQWSNCTLDAYQVPVWLPQALCEELHASDQSPNIIATLSAGFGVVGNSDLGYASGVDSLHYGGLQFAVDCDHRGNLSSCFAFPVADPPNPTHAAIVACVSGVIAPPPMHEASTSAADLNCSFRYSPASAFSGVAASCWRRDTNGSGIPVCLNDSSTWQLLSTPFCRGLGFDYGAIRHLRPEDAQVATVRRVLDVTCPHTFLPTALLRSELAPCVMTIRDVAIGWTNTCLTDGAFVPQLQCLRMDPPAPTIDWAVGAALFAFCAACGGVASCCSTRAYFNSREEARQANGLRRSKSRLRTRRTSLSPSSFGGSISGGSFVHAKSPQL